MIKYLLLSLVGISLLSCSDDDNSEQSEFIGKTFDYLFFETEQECIDAQPDPNFFINCHQELSFIDNEKAEIILTDIKYSVNYTIDHAKIIIHPSSNTIEFQNDIIFEKITDSSIKRMGNNTIWNQRNGNSLWN